MSALLRYVRRSSALLFGASSSTPVQRILPDSGFTAIQPGEHLRAKPKTGAGDPVDAPLEGTTTQTLLHLGDGGSSCASSSEDEDGTHGSSRQRIALPPRKPEGSSARRGADGARGPPAPASSSLVPSTRNLAGPSRGGGARSAPRGAGSVRQAPPPGPQFFAEEGATSMSGFVGGGGRRTTSSGSGCPSSTLAAAERQDAAPPSPAGSEPLAAVPPALSAVAAAHRVPRSGRSGGQGLQSGASGPVACGARTPQNGGGHSPDCRGTSQACGQLQRVSVMALEPLSPGPSAWSPVSEASCFHDDCSMSYSPSVVGRDPDSRRSTPCSTAGRTDGCMQTEPQQVPDVACQTLVTCSSEGYRCMNCEKPPGLPMGPAPLYPFDGIWQLAPHFDVPELRAIRRFRISSNRAVLHNRAVFQLKSKNGVTKLFGGALSLQDGQLVLNTRPGRGVIFQRMVGDMKSQGHAGSPPPSPSSCNIEELLRGGECSGADRTAPPPTSPSLLSSAGFSAGHPDDDFDYLNDVDGGFLRAVSCDSTTSTSTTCSARSTVSLTLPGLAKKGPKSRSDFSHASQQTEGPASRSGQAQTTLWLHWDGRGCPICAPAAGPWDGVWAADPATSHHLPQWMHLLMISGDRCVDAEGTPIVMQRRSNNTYINTLRAVFDKGSSRLRIEVASGVFVDFAPYLSAAGQEEPAGTSSSSRPSPLC